MRTAPRPAPCKDQSMGRGMVLYGTPPIWQATAIFEAIKLALLSVWMIQQELTFWTLQTTADKRCGQVQTVHNNAEKCRQTPEKCGQTADMLEWKCFDIERLCLVTYPYLCMIFTIFFSCVKVRAVYSTYNVRTCTFLVFPTPSTCGNVRRYAPPCHSSLRWCRSISFQSLRIPEPSNYHDWLSHSSRFWILQSPWRDLDTTCAQVHRLLVS